MTQFSFVPMAAAVLLSGLAPCRCVLERSSPCGLNPMDHPTNA